MKRMLVGFSVVALLSLVASTVHAQAPGLISTVTADGVTIHGEPYFADLNHSAPLVLLFHQGGSNGRGEYAEIASWLNSNGFRAIAWDQRAGGSVHGSTNRTVAGLASPVEPGLCDASPDLQAALDYVVSHGLADRVIVWGSSYSGALVFRLAAENPTRVRGLLAFSPASGPPMAGCEARAWVDAVRSPILLFRPEAEMERATSIEQRTILTDAGAQFEIVEHGVHGSSMLIDARTGQDMSSIRERVIDWLAALPH